MRAPRWWVERRRERLADRAADPVVAAWLRAEGPVDTTPLGDLSLLAVDLETTGLDPRTDEILSIGFVPVDGDRIDLSGARRLIVRPRGGVGSSATIHGLTDDEVGAGMDSREAVHTLLSALSGRALLAHHAMLEVGFVRAAVHRLAGVTVPVVSVCTMQLQERSARGLGPEHPAPELRLPDARRGWGLPRAPLHDALSDGLACAELYLAQRAQLLTERPRATLRQVRRS